MRRHTEIVRKYDFRIPAGDEYSFGLLAALEDVMDRHKALQPKEDDPRVWLEVETNSSEDMPSE